MTMVAHNHSTRGWQGSARGSGFLRKTPPMFDKKLPCSGNISRQPVRLSNPQVATHQLRAV